jgi:hypothetical protein
MPIDQRRPYDRLVATGLISPPAADRRGRHVPSPVRADGPVSDLVAEQRR